MTDEKVAVQGRHGGVGYDDPCGHINILSNFVGDGIRGGGIE